MLTSEMKTGPIGPVDSFFLGLEDDQRQGGSVSVVRVCVIVVVRFMMQRREYIIRLSSEVLNS